MSLLLGLAAIAIIAAAVGALAVNDMHWSSRVAAAGLLASLGLLSAALFGPRHGDAELERSLPVVGPMEGFGSSDTCRSCHPSQYDSWHGTFHRTMTQPAGPDTVLAPFDGRVLEERGGRFRVLRREGRFYVYSLTSDIERRVVMLTGSHNMQAYWLRWGDGRLMQFPFVYLVEEARWVANSDSFLQPQPGDDDGFAETVWGDGCVDCHSTGGPWGDGDIPANFDTVSAVTELGIACEACHGEAANHIATNRDPLRRYQLHTGDGPDPTIVNPRRLDAERSASLCGRCHTAAEHYNDAHFEPGMHLSEAVNHQQLWERLETHHDLEDPLTLEPAVRDAVEAFWRSGAVRVAGREYDGMSRSACFLEDDMSCVSCHQVHGGTPEAQLPPEVSDQHMCGDCHEEELADVPAHTHHAADSEGSRCVSCHMPYASYGLLKATRSHRLDSPVASGFATRDAPNACNLCHQDQSLGWTAERLAEWYGRPSPPIPDDVRDVPAGALWLLRGDAVQRALAAWHLRQPWVRESGEMDALDPALITLLADPVAAVRQVGGRTLQLNHPDWELDMERIATDPQPDRADALRGDTTGLVDAETFRRLNWERIDLPVSVPE